RADLAGLGLEARKLLAALAHVAAVAHHLAAVVLFQPRHDDAGVEPARIRQRRALHLQLAHFPPPAASSAASSRASPSSSSASVPLSGGSPRPARPPPRTSSSPASRAAATSAAGSIVSGARSIARSSPSPRASRTALCFAASASSPAA